MKNVFSLLLILISIESFAQIKKAEIHLTPIEIKKKDIPFYIDKVQFDLKSDSVATIYSKEKKGNILFYLPTKNKEEVFISFIENQFNQNKDGAPILLVIKKLELTPIKKGEFNPKDIFQFECNFYKGKNDEQDLLYTFKAKNEFGTFEDVETVLNNYIVRAINSGIEQFKTSFNNRIDWQEDAQNGNAKNAKPIKVNCIYNKINSNDSVACATHKKIDWSMFQENKKAKNENGNAKFTLTYKAFSEETSKQLKLDIFVYAFLDKKLSWKPQNIQNSNWLEYQQGMYDLCSFYGLKLQKEMRNYQYSLGEFRTELNKIYNDIIHDYAAIRKEYIEETDNGTNVEKTKEWRVKIEKMITQ